MPSLHVLTVTGRATGRPRSTPVTVVTVNNNRYLLEGFPGADWAANVRAADGRAQLSVGHRIEHVDLIELDPADALVVLRHWPRQAATGARIMRDAGIIDDITPTPSPTSPVDARSSAFTPPRHHLADEHRSAKT
jgi:deazaflavin-dependent oxidoreductase (nitroreductase family)